jgi:hypothetical protein
MAQAEPARWRLALMSPAGAPERLREHVERGRTALVAMLTELARPGLGPGRESPDPELTALVLTAIGEDAARLVLADPERYPPERLLDQARWVLGQFDFGGDDEG